MQRELTPPPFVRNSSTSSLDSSNGIRSFPRTSLSRGRGSTLGSCGMPSSPLASSSFSASSSQESPPALTISTNSSPRHRGMSASSSPLHSPNVKSRLRGLSVSAHAPRSGRGLMVLEGPEEPMEDFSDFSFAETPSPSPKPSSTNKKKPVNILRDSRVSWWGQGDFAPGEEGRSGQRSPDQKTRSGPQTPDSDRISPVSLRSFFDLPSPASPSATQVTPEMAPESVVTRSPQSIADGELPDLIADVESSLTSPLASSSLPDDVDDLQDLVKDLRSKLYSQESRFQALSTSLQDLAQRSAEWKHELEMAKDVKIPALELKIMQLNEEKAALEDRLQGGPRPQVEVIKSSEEQRPRSVAATGDLLQTTIPEGEEKVDSNDGEADGAKGPPSSSQILRQEGPPSTNAPVPTPRSQSRRGSIFSLSGARTLSWSPTSPMWGSSTSTAGSASPRDSIAGFFQSSDNSEARMTKSTDASEAEVLTLRAEVSRLKARLEEATEARKSSDDCLKALKDFIGEGAVATSSSSSSIGETGSTARGRSGSGSSLRCSLSGMKLPPLPTAKEEDEEEESDKFQAEESLSPMTAVRSSLGNLFARAPSISLGSGQALLNRAISIPVPSLPLSPSRATCTAEVADEPSCAPRENKDDGGEMSPPPGPTSTCIGGGEESGASTVAVAAAAASAVAPTLNRLGGWIRRASIWEGAPIPLSHDETPPPADVSDVVALATPEDLAASEDQKELPLTPVEEVVVCDSQ